MRHDKVMSYNFSVIILIMILLIHSKTITNNSINYKFKLYNGSNPSK